MLATSRFGMFAVLRGACTSSRALPYRNYTLSSLLGCRLKGFPGKLSLPLVEGRCSQRILAVSSSRSGHANTEAVVIDLEGASDELLSLWFNAVSNAIFQMYNVTPNEEDLHASGSLDSGLLDKMTSMLRIDQFDENAVVKMAKEIFIDSVEEADSKRTGLRQLIQTCLETEIRLLVPSDRSPQVADSKLFPDSSLLSCMSIGELVIDTFVQVAVKGDVLPERCLAITDTSVGARRAKRLGVRCLAVSPSETESEFVAAGANEVVKNLSLVTAHLDGAVQDTSPIDASDSPIQQWLRQPVNLPGSVRTDRRSVLQTLNLGLGATCIYLLSSRSQALSYANPRALLRLFNPFDGDEVPNSALESRTEAFLRYIADVERKGGGEEAPDFPSRLDWFNSSPLSLKRNLKGKMVILDFWTYCCINCMHVLPDLQYIEKTFDGQPVAVVGVHSAKFDNEKDSGAIRNAVLKYNVNHPVVNDGNMVMWKELGVNSWPTLIVLSPKGRVLFTLTGEGHRSDIEDILSAGLQYYGQRDLLNSAVLPLAPEKLKDDRILGSNLRYPGKLASDIEGDRLFISDSNNHRIVITTLSGEFLDQIGGNGPKLLDGSYESCSFNRPQGVCYDAARNCLYIADTENHALRRVDLQNKVVDTLAGNGYQGRDYRGGKKGQLQQLSSPWDVEMDPSGNNIFIAMAGQHQIWKYDHSRRDVEAFSGNGSESNRNGSNAQSTSWAQPSGLSLLPIKSSMIVADSESSSVRELDLDTGGSRSIAGGDPLFAENLFRFGDVDGTLPRALFQHPLGILATDADTIYIADSYNHKIRQCDLQTSTIKTVCGSGEAGYADGTVGTSKLSEPGGFAKGPSNTLFVADTNNNLIRIFDLNSTSISTLQLTNIPQPRVSPLDDDGSLTSDAPSKVMISEKATTQNGDVNITADFQRGFNFTEGAISTFRARVIGNDTTGIDVQPEKGTLRTRQTPNIQIHYTSAKTDSKGAQLQIDCKIYYCKEREECLLEEVRFLVPLAETLKDGNSETSLTVSPGADQ